MFVHVSIIEVHILSLPSPSLLILLHTFWYATLMSCKNSETEHVLSVVPISAGIGAGPRGMALKLFTVTSM